MIWALIQLILGGLFLWLASEGLVRGASALALRAGLSPLVVGLTIISLGTSSPELFVSGLASWQGNQGLALGNVIGSNMANLGLVLGLMALIRPVVIERSLTKREIPFLIGVSALTFIFAANHHLSRLEGLVLLCLLVLFIIYCLKSAGSKKTEELKIPAGRLARSAGLQWTLIIAGLAGLAAGSELFIRGAVHISRQLGVSEFLIGLSVVAIGTSLPELAASLVAMIRGHNDMAVGNLIGSNIFNLLLILSAAMLIKPIIVPEAALHLDFWLLLTVTLLIIPLGKKSPHISRLQGLVLMGVYIFFIFKIALRG